MARRPLLLGLAVLCTVPGLAVLTGAGSGGLGPGSRAKQLVTVLASQGPRPAGESGAERFAQEFVATELRKLGYRVVFQRVDLPSGRSTRNVVGLSSGRPKVVIVAHLDGVRGSPAANDNASGVAVLVELAASLRGEPGVLVAATGAEERAVTGSRVHLGSLRLLQGISPQARRGVRLAVALDMVGVGTRLHVRGIERAPNRSARLLLAQGRSTYLRDDGDSDHAELTRHGLPAAWLQWRTDRCWHEPCDVARRVDARRLEAAFRVVLPAAFLALKS
jgi:aminopeptidase YwaD